MNKKKDSTSQDHVLASSSARPKTLHEVTIFNVQRPLAASTAERKYERKQRPSTFRDSDEFGDLENMPSSSSLIPPTSQSSSLGLLDMQKVTPLTEMRRTSKDLSEERQLARYLLDSCNKRNEVRPSSGRRSEEYAASNFNLDPRDIQSRSSGISSSSQTSVLERSWYSSGISMSESLAERLNQYVDCDFVNFNEQVAEQLQPEPHLFHQSNVPPVPEFDSAEDLTQIIQNLDLSELEENARKSMSFSEYCKQKSGNFGTFDEDTVCRASLGLGPIESPAKSSHSRRLADVTMESEVLEQSVGGNLKDMTIRTAYTEETGEMFLVNLTSIANVINFEGKTPRSVVDELLNLNKKKTTRPRETYLLQDPPMKETSDFAQLREQRSLSDGFRATQSQRELCENDRTRNRTMPNDDRNSRTSSQSATLTNPSSRDARTSFQSANFNNISAGHHKSKSTNDPIDFEHEEISMSRQDTVILKNKSSSQRDEIENTACNADSSIKIINSQDITTCRLGIPKIHEIEVINRSSKWVLVTPSSAEIQGSKSNTKLEIPEETGLMKPGDSKTIPIVATIFEPCEPVKVTINLSMSHMVTRETWKMAHSFYLVGQECKIKLSESQELAFGEISENGCKILPLRIDNENETDVYVEIQILQNDKFAFYINKSENGNSLNINLEPLTSRLIKIQFHGIDLGFLKETSKANELLYKAKSILLIKVYADDLIFQKEISLTGCVGITDVNLCNVQLPIVVAQKEKTKLCVGNFGTVETTVTASVGTHDNGDKNFVIIPSKFSLRSGEKTHLTIAYNPSTSDKLENQVLFKITTGNGVKSYPVIVQEEIQKQLANETQKGTTLKISSSNSQSINSHSNGSIDSATSSTRTVKDDLPIRATHTALVWGCLKINKKNIKEFSIRNMSDSKLKLLATIESSNKTFKFYREGYGSCSNVAFSLHSKEIKTLSISFEPLKPGPHTGKILFQYYSRSHQSDEDSPMKIILLNGYCGHGSLEIPNCFRDPSGQVWMNLGKLNDLGFLETEIQIKNVGDLTCYTKIELSPKNISLSQTAWNITPNQFMVEPKQVRKVKLYFKPKKGDLEKTRNGYTAHIGTLKIIHGDEPTRLRIRRIYNRLANGGGCSSMGKAFFNYVSALVKDFPGEHPFDLGNIRDSSTNMNDLCREIREYDLHLTMEMRLDDTESILNETMDATFHTLINDTKEVTVFPDKRH